jgi:hypothetical protein
MMFSQLVLTTLTTLESAEFFSDYLGLLSDKKVPKRVLFREVFPLEAAGSWAFAAIGFTTN